MGTRTSDAEIARARALLHAEVKERDFQGEIVSAAGLLGWRTFHVFDSRRSAAGFPDLTMVRGNRMIMAELKREKGRLTPDQQAWIDDLGRVETVDAYVWRPSDWSEVEAVLR